MALETYYQVVNFNKYLRGLAKVTKTFTLELGPVRATGVPAILVAVSGIVLAAGVTKVLSAQSERLPETLREARALAQSLRPDQSRLSA